MVCLTIELQGALREVSRSWVIVFKAAKSDKVSPVWPVYWEKDALHVKLMGRDNGLLSNSKSKSKTLDTSQKTSFCPQVRDLQLRARVEDTS